MNSHTSTHSLLFPATICVASAAIASITFSGVTPLLVYILCILIVGLSVFGMFRQTKNTLALKKITTHMQRLAEGKYTASFAANNFGGHSEVAMMGKSMEAALTKIISELGFARGVLQGMATPCVVVDTTETLCFTNQNLLSILQHNGKPSDFYGQNVAHFFYGDATRPTVLGAALREQRDITKEVDLIGRRGAKRNIRIDASPLYDLHGKLMGSLCVYADLTELRSQQMNLQEINDRIAQTSEQADGIGQELAQAAKQLADLVETSRLGADRQRVRMSETATAMEEMNATVMEVARNATQAAETSAQARKHAENGAQIVSKVVEGIRETQKETLTLKQDMSTLGTQADSIGQIINVISDIADQTNLLALNAAIEAARAGDAGRGFAVVADEVRKLAEKTMTATKKVGEAIRGIQQGTIKSIGSVERAALRIDEATAMAGTSGEALVQIVQLVEITSDQVHSIATASEEQSAVSEEISRSIEQVSNISVATANDMTQATKAVEELAGQAQILSDLIREIMKPR